jgi:hypothetical protein
MGTSAPALRTVAQADQSVTVSSVPSLVRPQTPYVRTGPTFLPNRINWTPSNQSVAATQTASVTVGPAPAMSGSVPSALATQTATPFNQVNSIPSQATGPKNPAPTTAAAAINTKPANTMAEAPRPTLFEKIGNWLHPKGDAIRPADPKQMALTDKTKLRTSEGTKAAVDSASLSAAAETDAKIRKLPPSVPNAMATADPIIPSAPASAAGPPPPEKSDSNRPVVQAPIKKDWRTLWGRAKDPNIQVAGQSQSDQGPGKPADILLNPEKFDAYRGDPAQLMAKSQSPKAEEKGSTLSPADGRVPLGAQSVLAANGAASTNITYVPVPIVTVPTPNRPPLPPSRLPEPPPPTAYANAFTPPPQPQVYPTVPSYPSNPNMMVQSMSNTNLAPALPPSVQSIQYGPMPAPQPAQQAFINAAMDRRQTPLAAAAPVPEPAQIIQVLRESPYPAQREWASYTLATYDWRAQPEILRAVLVAAQQDPASTVRAACVYSLGRMNAASESVMSLLYNLRNDGDPGVRQEVEQALVRLGATKR